MVSFNFHLKEPYKNGVGEKIKKLKKQNKSIPKNLFNESKTAIRLIATVPKTLINAERAEVIPISVGRDVYPAEWDFKKKLPARNPELTSFLKDIDSRVNKAYSDYVDSGKPFDVEELRTCLGDAVRDKIKPRTEDDFFPVFERYLKIITLENPFTGKPANFRTIQKYKTLKKLLENFEESIEEQTNKKYKITFNGINSEFIAMYGNYLDKYAKNTKAKYIADFKTFVRWAFLDGCHKNVNFEKLKPKRVKTKKIILTLPEITKIFYCNTGTDRLERIKDVFMFQFLTGQRYQDIENLRWKDLDRVGKSWTLFQHKGDKEESISVPLHEHALEILNKYSNAEVPLPVISNQKYNDGIKDLCELAGIDTLELFKNNKEPLPKHKFISSHTCRRSLINVLGKLGVDSSIIKSISGHTKKGAFDESYREPDLEELLTAINKIKFEDSEAALKAMTA